MSKGMKLGAAMLGALVTTEAIAETKTPDVLDPTRIERVMTESGFIVPDTGLGTFVFESAGDGKFNITARIRDGESKACVQSDTKNGPTSVCTITGWQPPAGFMTSFANDTMRFEPFWQAVNADGDTFPTIGGGGEVPNPISATAFIPNATVNANVTAAWADVLAACADPTGRSKSAIGAFERSDCRNAKGALEVAEAERAGADRVARAEVDAQIQVAEAQSETERIARINQLLGKWTN